jgi:hypothetical protein
MTGAGGSWVLARAILASSIVGVIAIMHIGAAGAEERATDVFFDREDGALDASEWLLDRKGFLPVPIIITEPAVGYGGGAALLFFRQSIREATSETGHVTPPDIFGGAAFGTQNGTYGAAVGGMFTFDNDRWRYRGGIGKPHVNLDFYGLGGPLDTGDRSIGYTLDGWASSQQVLWRVGQSNHYLALRWLYLDLDSTFDQSQQRPLLSEKEVTARSSGLGPSWEYDSRDNIFTPSRGVKVAVDSLFFGPGIGGDNSFQTYRAYTYAYTPFRDAFVFGGRLDGRAARGDVPFYQMPYIDMRGIPAVRFQDKNVGVVEAELRWNVTSRWALIGFLGAGRAWGREVDFTDASNEVAKGGGFRYLIARQLGVYMGADVAWGPEDTAFYIQVGSAWW